VQSDLAAAAGISPATMCRIERGRHQPSPEVIERMARTLGCSVEAITTGDFIVESNAGRFEVRSSQG
jgi:DNA-binding XRE family transcriptional regulator